MKRINVLHFTKVINRNDFIDVIIRNADRSRFFMMASSYRDYANIEDPKYELDGIPLFFLNIDHGWLDIFRGAWRLSKVLKKEKIDVLHTHHYYEAVIGRMACIIHTKTKHIIGRHYHDQLYLTTKGVKLGFYLFAERVVNTFANAIIVPSSMIVELLLKQHVKKEKIKFIPYCFDFTAKRYQQLSAESIAVKRKELKWSDHFVIGNIARHHIIKGQTYLIRAFQQILKQIPNSLLVMIGDGPAHRQLIDEVNQLGIANSVIFLGWRKDGHELINCMDIIVHPSLQEAFPQLMIETMALRKPLVITPVSGVTDVVKNNINGFIIPLHNAEAIVEVVSRIHSHPNEAEIISQNGFEFVTTNFTIKKIIPQFEMAYESLIT